MFMTVASDEGQSTTHPSLNSISTPGHVPSAKEDEEETTIRLLASLPSDEEDEEAITIRPSLPPRQWPTDFYATEIIQGFLAIDHHKKLPQQTVATAFEAAFSVVFVPGTYYTHRAHWEALSPQTREKAQNTGRTHEGLYGEFMKTNLVKDTQKIARFARALAAHDYLMGYIEHERKRRHRYSPA